MPPLIKHELHTPTLEIVVDIVLLPASPLKHFKPLMARDNKNTLGFLAFGSSKRNK